MRDLIKFLPVNCGDAIRIIQKSSKNKTEGNILIDSGYVGTFNILYDGIEDIIKNNGKIDLWILTHLDADHINGAFEFLRDDKIKNKDKLIREFWFNFVNPFRVDTASDKVSLSVGIKLRDLLKVNRVNKIDNKIINTRNTIRINGRSITILSPDTKTYKELEEYWTKEESKYKKVNLTTKCADSESLDKKSILELAGYPDQKEPKKRDLANRSSIAFIYKCGNSRVLFLGDSMPSIVITSLKRLGYTKKNRLKVKYVKLSHHGSRMNFSKELLEYVDCDNFIISADGVNTHGIPDKEVFAKIILHSRRDFKRKLRFYFNHDDMRFRKMFSIDDNNLKRYNVKMCYLEKKTLKLKL